MGRTFDQVFLLDSVSPFQLSHTSIHYSSRMASASKRASHHLRPTTCALVVENSSFNSDAIFIWKSSRMRMPPTTSAPNRKCWKRAHDFDRRRPNQLIPISLIEKHCQIAWGLQGEMSTLPKELDLKWSTLFGWAERWPLGLHSFDTPLSSLDLNEKYRLGRNVEFRPK